MNFKEWLLLTENTIPEDDGTMDWWKKIPPEKLLDVFKEINPNYNFDYLLKRIQEKKEDILLNLLRSADQPLSYYDLTWKKKGQSDQRIVNLSKILNNYVSQKYSEKLKNFEQNNEFIHLHAKRPLLEKFPNHDRFDFGKKITPKNIFFQTKIYITPDVKSSNIVEIGEKIIDYFVENFNFFISMKFPSVSRRRELFIYYLSKLGEENKSKIESDINTMIKKYDPNYKESISFGVDHGVEGYGSSNEFMVRIWSAYAVAVHMDKNLIQKNLNYILSDKDRVFGLLGGNQVLIKNFKIFKPIMDLMQKKGIHINDFLDKQSKKYKPKDWPDEPQTQPDKPQTQPDKPQTQPDNTDAIHLGKVHVQLAGNKLKVQGSKAMFDLRLEPNQLQQIANLTKLESVMGTDLVTPVDLTKGGNPAGITIKNLGNADVHISKTALHLNKIQIPLKPQQVQYILNMLGMDQTAFEKDTKNSVLNLTAENGKTVKIYSNFFIGKDHFSDIPDFNKLYSDKQFNLIKNPSGFWTIQHNPTATNQTYLNDMPIVQPQKISSGMKITIGKSGKCPLHVKMT